MTPIDQARAIVSAAALAEDPPRPAFAAMVRAGRRDDSDEVQAALAAVLAGTLP